MSKKKKTEEIRSEKSEKYDDISDGTVQKIIGSENDDNKKTEDKLSPWKFIIAFIIFSAIVIAVTVWSSKPHIDPEYANYNGFSFKQVKAGEDIVWTTRVFVNGKTYDIPFHYHPKEVENVSFQKGVASAITDSKIKPKAVYITFDPDEGSIPLIGAVDISKIMGKRYGLLNLDVKSALTRNEGKTDHIIKTCNDAVNGTLVIYFRQGVQNAVYHEGNCLYMEYVTPYDAVRVADRFGYGLLKIMGS